MRALGKTLLGKDFGKKKNKILFFAKREFKNRHRTKIFRNLKKKMEKNGQARILQNYENEVFKASKDRGREGGGLLFLLH